MCICIYFCIHLYVNEYFSHDWYIFHEWKHIYLYSITNMYIYSCVCAYGHIDLEICV